MKNRRKSENEKRARITKHAPPCFRPKNAETVQAPYDEGCNISAMTLRDYFAAQFIGTKAFRTALAAEDEGVDVAASEAYRIADAMIAARKRS